MIEERLAELQIGLGVVDEDYCVVSGPRFIVELRGYRLEDVLGRPIEDLVHPDYQSALRERQLAAAEGFPSLPWCAGFRTRGGGCQLLHLQPMSARSADGTHLGSASLLRVAGAARHALDEQEQLAYLAQNLSHQLSAFAALIARRTRWPEGPDGLHCLSPREREVALRLGRMQSVGRIAQQLFISPHTVRNHRKAIYRKLGIHSQPELRKLLGS